MRFFIKRMITIILAFVFVVILVFGLPRLLTETFSQPFIYQLENAPSATVAIVFGAGLKRDGTPTPVLQDRVDTAVLLYQAGKVKKILVSGDNRAANYNEPQAMYLYAVSRGVPPSDIVLDGAGVRTYDTCYRARVIFGVKDALLVTQSYHLPRALYTCKLLGLNAMGVSADRRSYMFHTLNSWRIRELPATLAALIDLWVTHPKPVLGDPQPIFTETDYSNKLASKS